MSGRKIEMGENNLPLYEIRVKGYLPEDRSTWFGGMTLKSLQSGQTSLKGPIADQSALFGVLKKIRNCGLELISVNRLSHKTTKGAHKA